MDNPTFSEKSIELAITDYHSLDLVEYKEDQANIVRRIAELLHKRIVMNDLAIQGFIMRAIRSWQLSTNIKVSHLLIVSAGERVEHIRTIRDFLSADLKNALSHTRGEEELEWAVKEAFKVYQDEFSDRESKLY